MDVGEVAGDTEVPVASVFRAEMCRLVSFVYIHSVLKTNGKMGGSRGH